MKHVATTAFASLALLLVSCGPQVGAPVVGTVSGRIVKGPVAAASVTAFSVGRDGRRGKELGTTTSAEDGAFSVKIGGQSGPTLLCARDGTFVDEATGVVVGIGTNELCTLLDEVELGADTKGVLITPLTSLHAALAACFVGRDDSTLADASQRAALRLNDSFAAGTTGFDLQGTAPLDVTTSVAPSFSAEAWHGVLLAGLSESARQISLESGLDPAVRVTAATLTTELVRDIGAASVEGGEGAACVFDGQGPSGQLAQGNVALSANTLRGAPQGLAQSIGAFLDGERNASGISRESVEDLLTRLSTHESEIFAGDAGGDLDGPVVTFLEPAAGPVAGNPRVIVTATDASVVSELSFTQPETLAGDGELACDEDGCTLEATLNTALLPAGDVTLTARAVDDAGNASTVSLVVTVNNSIPVINVSAPSAGIVAGTVSIQAAAQDGDGLASFVVDVPGVVFASQCAPPLLVDNCDQELDPTIIDIQWDTTLANEGPVTIIFTATDTAGNPAFAQVAVDVDNIEAGTISGRVDFGSPVVGATVTAFEMTDGETGTARGPAIGSATTDELGLYQIVNAAFAGPVEVVATGGAFLDPATALTLSLRSGQELVAVLADVELGAAVVANINGWSTLAARRAAATASQSPSFAAAATFNANLFASHLLRPGSLSLTASPSADLFVDTPAPSDAAAIMALAHAGLSRLAAQLSIDVGGAPGQVTPVDLVDVLSADLSDGVLDGSDNGTALFLDQESVVADSYVLRTSLAIGIDNFVKNAPFRHSGDVVLVVDRNRSGITSEALSGADLLFDDLALDRSFLFPPNEPVIPFDKTPPSIVLGFGAPNHDLDSGAALSDVVSVIGTAEDTSGLSAFHVLAPAVDDLFSPVADLRVELDGSIAPNAADARALCGDAAVEDALALAANAGDAREVCLCVEAIDGLENSSFAAQCFTRPEPDVTTDALGFVGPARTSITAAVEGSFHIQSCVGLITQNGAPLGGAGAPGDREACVVVVPLAAPFQAGAAQLDIDVTEIGGAVLRSTFLYTVDLDAPAVSITAPVAGAQRQTAPAITALASDAHLVAVTADVTSNALPIALGLAGTIAANGAVTFPAFVDEEPDGARTILVTATDAAGNTTTAQRNYLKDTSAPVVASLLPSDGNPLGYFQQRETSAFVPSSACGTFPFSGCIFELPASAPVSLVEWRTTSQSTQVYRRWQHLANAVQNPTTAASPPAENRAPTLRVRVEPGVTVEARVDPECNEDAASFESRARAVLSASALGLVDIPFVDAQNLTSASTGLLRNQIGEDVLCLSMRPTDAAGNRGPIAFHFFRYQATPAPLLLVSGTNGDNGTEVGGYEPSEFQEDVAWFDDGHDDQVLSGSGQGASGRVVAHAYLVSPSSSTSYQYTSHIEDGLPARMNVAHREVVQISKKRAFNWCFTQDGTDADVTVGDGDDDLVNPDQIIANATGTPIDRPLWSGTGLDLGSSSASWALFAATGGSLLTAQAQVEHKAFVQGEVRTTVAHNPKSSYPTDQHTSEAGELLTFFTDLGALSLEVWSFNAVTGMPTSLIDAGQTITFSAGGSSSSSRHRLLLLRAPVPQNAITLKTAAALDGQGGTIGFNDQCSARNADDVIVAQASALPDDHWVVADASLASGLEPVPPRPLLWVKSGAFSECDGTSSHDCRYGRYFDDYVQAKFTLPSRTLAMEGRVSGVSDATFENQTHLVVPSSDTRILTQEEP